MKRSSLTVVYREFPDTLVAETSIFVYSTLHARAAPDCEQHYTPKRKCRDIAAPAWSLALL